MIFRKKFLAKKSVIQKIWCRKLRNFFGGFFGVKILKSYKKIFGFFLDFYGFFTIRGQVYYLYEILIFVLETSSYAYFKDNLVLIKLLNTYMGLKWIISILWTFKGPPTASRTETDTFREFFFLHL